MKTSQGPGVGRNMGFEPILKGPHVEQAKRNHIESGRHETKHHLESPEGMWEVPNLNDTYIVRELCPYSGRIDNCPKKDHSMPGRQKSSHLSQKGKTPIYALRLSRGRPHLDERAIGRRNVDGIPSGTTHQGGHGWALLELTKPGRDPPQSWLERGSARCL